MKIWDGDGTAVLRDRCGGEIPTIVVEEADGHDPHAVVAAVREQTGASTHFLRLAAADVVELEAECVRAPAPLAWTQERMEPPGPERPAWQRPGWWGAVHAELDEALAGLGLRRDGPTRHFRHTSVTALLRVPTTTEGFWLKATPPMFSLEAAVADLVDRLVPGMAPEVVARGEGWWLSREFPEEMSRRDDVLPTHARLQVASMGLLDELQSVGCVTRTLEAELEALERARARLVDCSGAAWGQRMDRGLARMAAARRASAAAGEPSALVHGDLHGGNVRPTGDGWLVFDWTDASIGHPFADLALALAFDGPAAKQRRVSRYARQWEAVLSPRQLELAEEHWRSLGALHQSATYARMLVELEGGGADEANAEDCLGWLRYWLGVGAVA